MSNNLEVQYINFFTHHLKETMDTRTNSTVLIAQVTQERLDLFDGSLCKFLNKIVSAYEAKMDCQEGTTIEKEK